MAADQRSVAPPTAAASSVQRLSWLAHALRALVHLHAGWLAAEPRFEVKALLADHLHDDARAISKLLRRIDELGGGTGHPGGPGPALAALIERAEAAPSSEAYRELAYGTLKPQIRHVARVQLEASDPVADGPTLRLLGQLLHRQERHLAEIGAAPEEASAAAEPPLVVAGAARETRILPAPAVPARDAFVAIADEQPAPLLSDRLPAGSDGAPALPGDRAQLGELLHALLHAELCAAELAARISHERPDLPWELHVDLARRCWDELRHAEALDRLLSGPLDCRWGEHPVSHSAYRAIAAQEPVDRLALLDGDDGLAAAAAAAWPASVGRAALVDDGLADVASALDVILAEEAVHARLSISWGAHLLGADEPAYRAQARELRATFEPGSTR